MTASAGLNGLFLGTVVFAASAGACALVLAALRHWTVLDAPNHRSSHAHPVPRGGGAGFILVILVAWTFLWLRGEGGVTLAVLFGAGAIALVSFADDLRGVPMGIRLAVQAAAVFVAVLFYPSDAPIISADLPPAVDRLVAGLAWLWFANLFNFMDGIDGIAAGEASVIAFGIVLLAAWRPELGLPSPEAIAVGAAVLAFLPFNWPPARMFMGDVGSVVLGYLLGWLLATTASAGAPMAAILLPLYFSADATSTLLFRAWRREPLAQAHRDHAYQRGVDKGLSHAQTTSVVVILGIVLIALAILSLPMPITALWAGSALTLALIIWLRAD